LNPSQPGSIWTTPIAVVDVETTGLSATKGDRVVELAIVRAAHLLDPEPVEFSVLINPDMAMPATAERIHGISDQMLANEPRFSGVIDPMNALLEGAIFVAHNARFDLGFLEAECARCDVPPPKHGPVLDSLRVARTLFAFPSCGLSALSERMAVDLSNHHRALADAKATLQILRQMLVSADPNRQQSVTGFLEFLTQMRKGGQVRKEMKQQLRAAAKGKATLDIDYTKINGPGALTTTRRITVDSFQPPNIRAWCHLRDEQRVFRLDRIHRISSAEENFNSSQ
jgi:DNA polymerase III epsilon subunit family exonuclease